MAKSGNIFKGQLISKGHFGILNSSKKQTKTIKSLTCLVGWVFLFVWSFFGRIEDIRVLLKLTDFYETKCFVACIFRRFFLLIMVWVLNMKKLLCCLSLELFRCLSPLFSCLLYEKTARLPGKNYKRNMWTPPYGIFLKIHTIMNK